MKYATNPQIRGRIDEEIELLSSKKIVNMHVI